MLVAWVWVQSGTAVKDQSSHDLASEYGAQRACFKARVQWDWKGSNPVTTLYCICSDGAFSTTIGRLSCWSALGSIRWNVRLPPVTHWPPQLLQLKQNSSSVCRWSRTVVDCCWFQSCGRVAVKCVLCVQCNFCFLRKWQTLKDNAYASGCCFRLAKLVQTPFRC